MMGELMIRCPKTGKPVSKGIYIEREKLGAMPVFFSSSFCPSCDTSHVVRSERMDLRGRSRSDGFEPRSPGRLGCCFGCRFDLPAALPRSGLVALFRSRFLGGGSSPLPALCEGKFFDRMTVFDERRQPPRCCASARPRLAAGAAVFRRDLLTSRRAWPPRTSRGPAAPLARFAAKQRQLPLQIPATLSESFLNIRAQRQQTVYV
jgi:hypothetical protein